MYLLPQTINVTGHYHTNHQILGPQHHDTKRPVPTVIPFTVTTYPYHVPRATPPKEPETPPRSSHQSAEAEERQRAGSTRSVRLLLPYPILLNDKDVSSQLSNPSTIRMLRSEKT